VGESGSGKSQTVLALMGLLARNGSATGQALYHGQNLLTLPAHELNRIRGNRMAMIFQDPMTSLNPYLTVERQMTEVLQLHKGQDRKQAEPQAGHSHARRGAYPRSAAASTCTRTSSQAACASA
jgi:oligopeptide transport system ATP-binding protein